MTERRTAKADIRHLAMLSEFGHKPIMVAQLDKHVPPCFLAGSTDDPEGDRNQGRGGIRFSNPDTARIFLAQVARKSHSILPLPIS